jgi:hypothetical protein
MGELLAPPYQGTVDMKKTPASAPEPTNANASKNQPSGTSKTDLNPAMKSKTSASTDKTKRPAAQPLLDAAVDAARKVLKRKPAAKPDAAKKPAKPETQVAVEAPTVVRRTYTRRKKEDPLEVPPILLEGDAPSTAGPSGPGEKYSLGATPPAQHFSGGELPESYGTKKLFLTARDPHWLYAHWDLTREQQVELNSESTDGHLILRIFSGKVEGHPAYEIHVHPDSRHWFAHVERAGCSYAAELGYYSGLGKWTRIAVSSFTVTPPDAAAKEEDAEFATIPFEFPFARLMQIIEDAVRDNIPLAQAIEELRRAGHPDLPRFAALAHAPSAGPGTVPQWTPEQEKALAKIISIDETRRVWMGSLEITELIRRRLAHEVTSPVKPFGAPELSGLAAPSGISSVTSPFGGAAAAAKSKGFWFNVNAELIIYGATEPDAKVTLGGHEIKLRSDGTFSFRFALPDGNYDLPAVAVSADGTDGRAAELKFSRQTEYLGDVGATPQDPALKPPTPDNL